MRHMISALQRLAETTRSQLDLRLALRRPHTSKAVSAKSEGIHLQGGLVSSTLVATPAGWQPVAGLFKGDEVITFDHGRQKIVAHDMIRIKRDAITEQTAYTMAIPAGVLGNNRELHVMPDQEVLVESDEAEELFGDPFVLIPAAMLEGFKDIQKCPVANDFSLSMLAFEREEILYCNGGLLCLGHADRLATPELAARGGYPRLTAAQLQALMVTIHKRQLLRPAFAGQSVEETYAAIEARLA
ncbi:MAG: hypothetical protein EA339_01895 [Rhodobacteraceae bacterium]|nr:MAG: hypothetical protein EA339_01895 [Paracoccaceae bacterium]